MGYKQIRYFCFLYRKNCGNTVIIVTITQSVIAKCQYVFCLSKIMAYFKYLLNEKANIEVHMGTVLAKQLLRYWKLFLAECRSACDQWCLLKLSIRNNYKKVPLWCHVYWLKRLKETSGCCNHTIVAIQIHHLLLAPSMSLSIPSYFLSFALPSHSLLLSEMNSVARLPNDPWPWADKVTTADFYCLSGLLSAQALCLPEIQRRIPIIMKNSKMGKMERKKKKMKHTGQTCCSATPKARPDKNISMMTAKYVRRIIKKKRENEGVVGGVKRWQYNRE